VTQKEKLKVRPYARLLTMLGEQLIKNDRVALVELIKNSYDADASRVEVNFIGFSEKFQALPESRIAIADTGSGMSEETIRQHWMNPATDGKLRAKQQEPKTASGRFIQGEKGIGRFAIFKLGNAARVTSREKTSQLEFVIEYDLGFLDKDNESHHDEKSSFLDELEVSFSSRAPEIFDGRNAAGLASKHGTAIEIMGLRSEWSEAEVSKAFDDVARLQPIVPPLNNESRSKLLSESISAEKQAVVEPEAKTGFSVQFLREGRALELEGDRVSTLRRLFEDRAVLSVGAYFDPVERVIGIDVNGAEELLSLDASELTGLNVYRKYFGSEDAKRDPMDISCGPFRFDFYVFDLSPSVPDEYRLDRDEKRVVKDNRIYLYRDDVRVLPYGDPEDDWLQLDVIRGTQGANKVLSNDQVIGFVRITQQGNPSLRDKTNREGLLDSGDAYADFVTLVQLIIAFTRSTHFARYRAEITKREEARKSEVAQVERELELLGREPSLPAKVQAGLNAISKAYQHERELTRRRLERTEDLAGVGLSVEAASHDIVAVATQALRLSRKLEADIARSTAPSDLLADASSLGSNISFVVSRLHDIQGLFVSTRQRRRRVGVLQFVEQVGRMYGHLLSSRSITFVSSSAEDDFEVLTTDAAMLQVLVNLIDNAAYWLAAGQVAVPCIQITLQPAQEQIIVSDNGPGIAPESAPYIFEPFFSGKGESGKGLGLYIARQVGARNGFTVDAVRNEADRILPGANFVISFKGGLNND
jgi:signal transduction histidine kinase